MSIILRPLTVNAQEPTQLSPWVMDIPTINLRNGEEFLSSSSVDASNVQQKPTSSTPSVTITPIFKAAGAGKRKGSFPLKNIKQTGNYPLTDTSTISLSSEPQADSSTDHIDSIDNNVQAEPVDLSMKKTSSCEGRILLSSVTNSSTTLYRGVEIEPSVVDLSINHLSAHVRTTRKHSGIPRQEAR